MLKKIFNLLIVIFPILSAYRGIADIDLGSITLFIGGLLCLISNISNFRLILPKGFGIFYIVALVFSIIFTQSLPLRLTLFTINLILACCYLDINKIINIYSKVVIVSCVFFLIQEASFYIIGTRIPGLLPFLPTIYDTESISFLTTHTISTRSSSFFLEPSYFAQFLFPYIAYYLFSDKNKDIYKALFVSLITILIRSGNGIILLAIIWVIWLLSKKIKLVYKVLIISLGIIGVSTILAIDQSIFSSLMERSSELQSYKGDNISSGFIRFFRGYYVYSDLPLFNQIFGSSSELIEQYRKVNIFFKHNDYFFNGIQMLLLHNGFIILVLYIRHLLLLGNRNSDIRAKVFIICILFLMLGESYYLTSRIFFVTIFLFGLYQSQNIKYKTTQYKI